MCRQGKQKAIMALTHKILVIAWNLLSTGALYDDPGTTTLHKRNHEQLCRCAIHQLEAPGYQVTVKPREPDAA
jgi:transposase